VSQRNALPAIEEIYGAGAGGSFHPAVTGS
jgi:hypothetical protein